MRACDGAGPIAGRAPTIDKKASMTHNFSMQSRPVTVFATAMFARAAEKIWSDDERLVLIDFIARNPENGDFAAIIKGGW